MIGDAAQKAYEKDKLMQVLVEEDDERSAQQQVFDVLLQRAEIAANNAFNNLATFLESGIDTKENRTSILKFPGGWHHTALTKAISSHQPKIVSLLTKYGADAFSVYSIGTTSNTSGEEEMATTQKPLALSIRHFSASIFKNLVYSLDDYYEFYNDACYAVYVENVAAVEILMEKRVNFFKSAARHNVYGEKNFPLRHAIRVDNVHIVSLLLDYMPKEEINVNDSDIFWYPGEHQHIFLYAAENGSSAMLKMMAKHPKVKTNIVKQLEDNDFVKLTALNLYAANQQAWPDPELCKLLIDDAKTNLPEYVEKDFDAINAFGFRRRTALLSFLEDLPELVEKNRKFGDAHQCCMLLLENGAQGNVENHDGNTAVIYAANYAQPELLDLVLQKGGMEHIDKEGGGFHSTPLIEAIKERNLSNAFLLIEKGANVSYVDKDGDTALAAAREMARLIHTDARDYEKEELLADFDRLIKLLS